MVLDTTDLNLNYSNTLQDNDYSAEKQDDFFSSLSFALSNEDGLFGLMGIGGEL